MAVMRTYFLAFNLMHFSSHWHYGCANWCIDYMDINAHCVCLLFVMKKLHILQH